MVSTQVQVRPSRSLTRPSQVTNRHFGGGLYTDGGRLFVTRSIIADNDGTFGGAGIGIRDAASATVIDSLIRGNEGRLGAGVVALNSDVELINSTVSGNVADNLGGGLFVTASNTSLIQSTITNNSAGNGGGGIGLESGGSLDSVGSIVAGNHAVNRGLEDVEIFSTVPISARHSLFGVAPTIDTDNGGNQGGTAASPLDAKLASLTDNGGPTQTHGFAARQFRS